MAVIGMVGGLGPESTLDYYKRIIEKHRILRGPDRNPEILIYSVDMYKLMEFLAENRTDRAADFLVDAVMVLAKGGATFAFLSANTPHIVFEQVQNLSPIPLISIVEETRKAAVSRGIRQIGLLGTRFTMQSSFYRDAFAPYGIRVTVPLEAEQEYIHDKLMTEIELGVFAEKTRQGLLRIVARMMRDDGIEGVILGCTELPLILTKDEFGIPFLNTTQIHVDSVLDYYITELKRT